MKLRLPVHSHLPGLALALGCVTGSGATVANANHVRWGLTTPDLSARLALQPPLASQPMAGAPRGNFIQINPTFSYPKMLGLGSSLEPSACSNLWRSSEADRERTIERRVSPTAGIGMNLMRIYIGTPDFTGDAWHSYDDLPPGEADPGLNRFSIEKDRAYILPVLKLARQKNTQLPFFASPWSPPGWMRSTGTTIGGHLRPQGYAALMNARPPKDVAGHARSRAVAVALRMSRP